MSVAAAAETSFWRQLTPEERRAAGLEQLTPEQQAALDTLASRYAQASSQQVREEVRAEVKREVAAEQKTKAVARAGLSTADNTTIVHTRIVGPSNGWSGTTIFRLENGQVWVQTDSTDRFWMQTVESPEIELRPASLGGWKLFLAGRNVWVHVRRVR